MLPVCNLSHFFLFRIVERSTFVNCTFTVAENDVAELKTQEHFGNGDAGGARAADHDLEISGLFACYLERVQNSGASDDGSSMLVVVKDRDVAHFDQAFFDLKTAGRADILEIDTAEALGYEIDGVYDFIRIFTVDADRYGVDACKSLEQRAFSLHDRHTG